MDGAAWAVPTRPGGPITAWRHAGCHQARRRRAGTPPVSSTSTPAVRHVEVVVPVHNQAGTLEHDIRALRRSLDESFPFLAVVTIADTGSRDGTAPIARRLAATVPGVRALLLDRDDRAHALRMALASSTTEIVACADDVSSASLPGLRSLVDSVLDGSGDLAVARATGALGGRSEPGAGAWARVRRRLQGLASSERDPWDADCGLTAVRQARALEILPLIEDHRHSFAAGLVKAADRRGLRIAVVPLG